MSWFRDFSRKLFSPYKGSITTEQASKYLNIARISYFFSVTTLAMYLCYKYEQHQKLQDLESGKPVIVDHSEAHRSFRQGSAKRGIIYTYTHGEGLSKEELTKEEYYEILEKEALERAKEAQRKALAEGRELPEDAIRLV